jgi:Arc/MetJ-type ribon-helix-helix transcriptional regulator
MYMVLHLTVVPVRLRDEEVGKLNLLLKRGVYRSRNEAIRAILAEGLEERLGEDEDVTSLVNKLLRLRRNGRTPISFKSSRRVVEIVAEGRH